MVSYHNAIFDYGYYITSGCMRSMRLIHLTDLHLTQPRGLDKVIGKRILGSLSWYRRRRFIHKRSILDLVAAFAISEKPDLVVITGDLVQLGLTNEIKKAGCWLKKISGAVNLFLVPGNHDLYSSSSVWDVYRLWSSYMRFGSSNNGLFPTYLELGQVMVVGLSSALPTPFWSATGRLDDGQLYRLKELLEKCRNKFICVLVHHPPIESEVPVRKQLKESSKFREILLDNRVDLVLHGHLHRNVRNFLEPTTQVFCTASASSIQTGRVASYRVIDVSCVGQQFNVSSVLKTLDIRSSKMETVETTTWNTLKKA